MRYALADRLFMASGPIGLVLLFANLRLGIVVLLLVVPALYHWKERELKRTFEAEFGGIPNAGYGIPASDTDPYAGLRHSIAISMYALDRIGSEWPEKDGYGNPMVTSKITFFDESVGEWRTGELGFSLSGGAITPIPNLHIWITEESELKFASDNSTWLVERLDLDYTRTAWELRGIRFDRELSAYGPQRILFVMRGSGIALLDSYLDAYGPDPADWIEREPDDWTRLAPPAVPESSRGG